MIIDVASIERGIDYTVAIEDQIRRAHVVLVVIGPDWLDARDDQQQLRLADPDDPVILEIQQALSGDKKVIPLLVDGAQMPAQSELPSSISNLSKRNGMKVGYESFDRDMQDLIREDLESKLLVPGRFADQTAIERFAEPLTDQQFVQLVAVLRSRNWTPKELTERIHPLRPKLSRRQLGLE